MQAVVCRLWLHETITICAARMRSMCQVRVSIADVALDETALTNTRSWWGFQVSFYCIWIKEVDYDMQCPL